MRRVTVQRLALLSSRYTHASAPLSSAAAQGAAEKSAESATGQNQQIIFPREGPGVNYALNWALCAKGIAPKGEAYRNLRGSELKKLNASIPKPSSTTKVYARGSYTAGATDISKAQFNRLFKEVTAFLANSQKIYVHDGAVGSSPLSDAKVRTISDNPSSALLFRSILEPVPTRQVSSQVFPFTVYIASNYSPSDVGSVGLSAEDKAAFVVIDYDRSAMILVGSAFTDVETIKKALAALTAPSVLSRDALPLSARILSNLALKYKQERYDTIFCENTSTRLVIQGGATVVVFAPESVIQKNAGVLKAAVSPDLGVVWSKEGVARLFASKDAGAPNLYKAPSSVVLVTADSSGAIPEISKVTPEKAGALFVAGYNGDDFQPGYQAGPGSVDPVELGKGFTAMLESTNVPAFLVNASVLAENDLLSYIESTVSEKLPKSKGKKPSVTAGTGQPSAAPVSESKTPQ
ncbi:uncharacterized protein [Physcomitrium patens]|uniref:uncharacterized protein isoform X1 n=1 Tax=Physcomitrium patens TaxID=3218 RepID=UPI000D1777EE|nr:uncharacterized protein LOC112293744 isoform X1 [Physcomitrium patens]|eukprot:XP_024399305.1 uncharacterized protein LOC112293744 isoform X1 [Physcomitrella patens]